MRSLSTIDYPTMTYRAFRRAALVLLFLCQSVLATAEQPVQNSVEVEVLDRNGDPVPDVLVMLDTSDHKIPEEPFVMDQRGMQFDPYVLVIPRGASVTFPNSDPVAHHVYSFTRPNNFVLPLYKGEAPEPTLFEHEGVVVLGCNIHDHMVGYIVVTHKKVFGWTDENGKASIGPVEPEIAQNIRIWSPRIKLNKEKTIALVDEGRSVRFNLSKRLRSASRPEPPESIYE